MKGTVDQECYAHGFPNAALAPIEMIEMDFTLSLDALFK
jgi:hypothetical protein